MEVNDRSRQDGSLPFMMRVVYVVGNERFVLCQSVQRELPHYMTVAKGFER